MAVQNSIAAPVQQKAEIKCTFKAGNEEVTLTPKYVKAYLATGKTDKVTEQDIVMFINLCKYQHLNPFLREAYLIKYDANEPARMVVGKSALEARADRDERFRGCDSGIVVQKSDRTLEYRKGTLVLPDETLVGGWAEVYVEGYKNTVYTTVSLSEYNSNQSVWKSKPATMIRKVAKMQALREAFPNSLSGMYTLDEYGGSEDDLPHQPVEQPAVQEEVIQHQMVVEVKAEPEILDGSDLL